MLKLDLLNVPNQRFNTVINGVNLVIEMRQFRGIIYMSVFINDEPVACGIKCVPNVTLLPIEVARIIGGDLFFTTEEYEYPNASNLNGACKLIYATFEELKNDN